MKILFALPLIIHPPDAGAKLLTRSFINALRTKHQVSLITIARSDQEKAYSADLKAEFGDAVTLRSPNQLTPLHKIGYYAAYRLKSRWSGFPPDAYYGCPGTFVSAVRQKARSGSFDIVHYDFWFSILGDRIPSSYKRVVLAHDLEYIRRKRAYENEVGSAKAALKRVYEATLKAETIAYQSADVALAVTEVDADAIRNMGAKKVIVAPLGMDTQKKSPPVNETANKSFVYVGSFTHTPNVDAIVWFGQEIWPLIRQKHPEASLTVVGNAPPDEVKNLELLGGITVTGRVESVDPYIADSRVSVVPLRVGSGIKTKIVEAMAFGRPVVTTSVGAEGMGLSHGSNVLVADTAQDFAEAACQLLQDFDYCRSIGNAAREFVVKYHSMSAATERLLEIYEHEIFT